MALSRSMMLMSVTSGMDDAVAAAGNERFFEDENDDDLNWEVVYRSSGVGEPITSLSKE